jgi:predicted tellurium resistance membrane protein TerC
LQLADGNRYRGTAQLDRVTVAGQTYDRGQVRSLRLVRSGPANVLSDIVLPLVTLTAMEIVLGIDNIIFLAIVAGRLPERQQPRARRIGLAAAMITRLALLATLSFILGLTAPVFTLPQLPFLYDLEAREVSWRDVIMLLGGAFLIGKSTFEIHDKLEHAGHDKASRKGSASFGLVLVQIAIIDIIFSLDSVITAVGMVESLWVMVTAVVISVGVMMLFAEPISRFVGRNPTLTMLALSFLILIGVLLVAEGFGQHINKGYVYFAMAFSVVVEFLNIRLRKKTDPVHLRHTELPAGIS